MGYRVGKKNFLGKNRTVGRTMPAEIEVTLVNNRPMMKCLNCGHETNISDDTVDILNLNGKNRQKCSACLYEYMVFSNVELPLKSISLQPKKKLHLTSEQKQEIIRATGKPQEIADRFNISIQAYQNILRKR